jgi:5-deoxy-5-amino-3-dehydroquinate synthase
MSLSDQIYACIELKASAVEADERDEGRRAILNYGHTLAHALEGHWLEKGERGWSHGEAVAVGVVFAARIAHRLGRISSDRVDETISTVRHFGLSTSLPSDVSTRDLFKFMARDKKSNGGYTFILPSNEGMEAVHHIPYEVVEGVLASMPTEDHEP